VTHPIRNLLAHLPHSLPAEQFDTLLQRRGVRIERILSTGQSSPPGFWYDQDEDEWILLLSGSATLLIEGENSGRDLFPGDTLLIPAHCRHRVERTGTSEPTVWLALFFPADSRSDSQH